MVVYADVLMLVNFVVDYFLILAACRFLQKKPRLWRIILSAAIGGVFSLYIFLPQSNFLLQMAVQIIMCAVLWLIVSGFGKWRAFLRGVAVLFAVNFAYSGAMIALWVLVKPNGMVINNSVVYFDVSPLFLILFSIMGYFLVAFLRQTLKKPFSNNTYCTVKLFCGEKSIFLSGIADTGNSITDVFGTSEIFITEKSVVESLLGARIHDPARLRKIPCLTVAGEKLLDGYRADGAQVEFCGKKYDFKNPILAISVSPLAECQIIVNPENLI